MKKSVTHLRAVREAQGRSQADVAREAHVNPGYLSRVERGLQQPSVAVLLRVGRALGVKRLVDVLELFGGDE